MSYQIVVKAGDSDYCIKGLSYDQATQIEAVVSMVASEVSAQWMESEQVWRISAFDPLFESCDIETLVKEDEQKVG